ncbi:unnamed protein product [Bursaphelenchus xylophilus]|uniref:(pine wood nematode) hypothetical protein n=1 Tax=Bursaphelenchus xylophilus TaxID=6326 RepID=A0A1I7S238_BURXY|nr:unnamed protein product [Bursaphelenchus xylophilus]CAG9114946.1 unnamed protein product [Bursaphelenchus xylophilus]
MVCHPLVQGEQEITGDPFDPHQLAFRPFFSALFCFVFSGRKGDQKQQFRMKPQNASMTSAWTSAGQGVTQVMNRCESAKSSGFLDLTECSLMYITDAIYLVLKEYEITKCSLKGNDLKKFPKKMIIRLPELEVLNLEGNKIDEIPEEIVGWKETMKGINLAKNQIKSIPDAFLELENIVLLDLSGNAIDDIDENKFFKAFPNLKQVNLHENPLSDAKKAALKAKCPAGVNLRLE